MKEIKTENIPNFLEVRSHLPKEDKIPMYLPNPQKNWGPKSKPKDKKKRLLL